MHAFRRIPGLSPWAVRALTLALMALLAVFCVPAPASSAHQGRAPAPAGSSPLVAEARASGTPAYTDQAMTAATAPMAGDGDSPSCSGGEEAPAVVPATGAGDPVAAPEVHGRPVPADPGIHGARAPTSRDGPVTHDPHAFTVLRI
ncbi:hypothetical protein ACG5V6_13375 [Streptomyces chitinivorans]|uniref:Secreted protein n=1 Tax=Streptomyces chitinivorans TaxID=1257027 RepID=A0ABW7HTI9_9ACTN|nr:hypothetical protein [Streptomyces chitinivorans]MDH2411509.1 hypothetical protein [Streptomyces chitinivorans]